MLYKQQIEQVLGQQLPELGNNIPPQVMNELALLAAQATQVVTGQAQAMAQAMAQAQTNPIVELKQQELAQKAQTDLLKSQVDLAKIESNEAIAEMKIAQDREETLLKEQENIRKTYADILKEIRQSDTINKGV